METHRRKRGISLTHQTNKSNSENFPDPRNPVTTAINYVRYPIITNHLRPNSTPKPRVQFNYTAQHSGYFNQNTLNSSSCIVESRSIVQNQETYQQKPFALPTQTIILSTPETIVSKQMELVAQKYQSFQQCKELIGKRLFGDNLATSSNVKCLGAARTNSFVRPSKIEEFNLYLQRTKQNKPAEEALQESSKMNIIPIEKLNQKVKMNQTLKISSNVEIKVECKQKKLKERPKDTKKLQQMERKLLQIIKICDQNV